ncbi:MAG: hypothetical protein JNL79_11110 [Myxococcales bacterium]|nr:hypothetical protein [Myxococcales bacterium]
MRSRIHALLALASLVGACSGEAPVLEPAPDAGAADPAPPGPPPRLLWASPLYRHMAPQVATDGDGNVYVSDSGGVVYPRPPPCRPEESGTVTKFDPSGKQLWVRCFHSLVADLAVGRGGRIVLATVGGLDSVELHALDGEGVERWKWTGHIAGINPIARVTVGPLGHVIAALGSAPIDRPADRTIRVQQLLPDGTPGWVRGLDSGYTLQAVASDDTGSYFVAAQGLAGTYDGGDGPKDYPSGIVWWKLDSTGVPRLTRRMPGPASFGNTLVTLAADERLLWLAGATDRPSEVRAFDVTTGADAWRTDLPGARGRPAIAAAGEGRLAVVTSQPGTVSWVRALASLDLFDDRGKKVWSTWHPTHSPTGMDDDSEPTSVAVSAGKVVVGGHFRGVVDFGAGSYAADACFLARFEL